MVIVTSIIFIGSRYVTDIIVKIMLPTFIPKGLRIKKRPAFEAAKINGIPSYTIQKKDW